VLVLMLLQKSSRTPHLRPSRIQNGRSLAVSDLVLVVTLLLAWWLL
jgi:hypothetical protein